VADETAGEIVNDVEQRGKIEDVFGDRVGSAFGPGAVAVAAEVQGVDVVVVGEGLGDPVPVAGVVESAVD